MENKNEIDIIENNIDQTWHNLSVYKLPLHIALFVVLSFFTYDLNNPENKPKVSSSIVNARQGLYLLIPNMFKNCPHLYVNKRAIKDLRDTNTPYIYAVMSRGLCEITLD